LQQEVMANRDREQEIYDYYSNEAIVVRLEQLQRLSSSAAIPVSVRVYHASSHKKGKKEEERKN
jgi:hypothetical protein